MLAESHDEELAEKLAGKLAGKLTEKLAGKLASGVLAGRVPGQRFQKHLWVVFLGEEERDASLV